MDLEPFQMCPTCGYALCNLKLGRPQTSLVLSLVRRVPDDLVQQRRLALPRKLELIQRLRDRHAPDKAAEEVHPPRRVANAALDSDERLHPVDALGHDARLQLREPQEKGIVLPLG